MASNIPAHFDEAAVQLRLKQSRTYIIQLELGYEKAIFEHRYTDASLFAEGIAKEWTALSKETGAAAIARNR